MVKKIALLSARQCLRSYMFLPATFCHSELSHMIVSSFKENGKSLCPRTRNMPAFLKRARKRDILGVWVPRSLVW